MKTVQVQDLPINSLFMHNESIYKILNQQNDMLRVDDHEPSQVIEVEEIALFKDGHWFVSDNASRYFRLNKQVSLIGVLT